MSNSFKPGPWLLSAFELAPTDRPAWAAEDAPPLPPEPPSGWERVWEAIRQRLETGGAEATEAAPATH